VPRGSHVLDSIKEQAGVFGFERITLDNGHVVRWKLKCGRCPTEVLKGWEPNTSPSLMVRNMRRQGWLLDDREPPVCPACQKKEKEAMRKPTPDRVMTEMISGKFSPPPPVAPVQLPAPPVATLGPDPKLARRIYAKLDEVFNDTTRLYVRGWDDARVAQEVQTSALLVERIRREAYGELAEDPVLSELRDDLELHKMEIAEAISALQKDANDKIVALQARIEALPGQHKKAAG